jgi:hypothetical protein
MRSLPDFLWVGGRILIPSLAAAWPPHWLKAIPITGEIFFAVRLDHREDDNFRASLREGYGIILNEQYHPSTLEERMVKELEDRSSRMAFSQPW